VPRDDRRNPAALSFPSITVGDRVRAQTLLIDHLGIDTLSASSAARRAAMHSCNGDGTLLVDLACIKQVDARGGEQGLFLLRRRNS
jgi:hypothetical protein